MSRPGLNGSLREADAQLWPRPLPALGAGEALAVAAPVLRALGGCLRPTVPAAGLLAFPLFLALPAGHGLVGSSAQHPAAARAGQPPLWLDPLGLPAVSPVPLPWPTGHRSPKWVLPRVGGGLCQVGPTPRLLLVLRRPVAARGLSGPVPQGSSEKMGAGRQARSALPRGRGVSCPSPTDVVFLSLAPTGLNARGFDFTGKSRGSVK